jgi:hypothetical protein
MDVTEHGVELAIVLHHATKNNLSQQQNKKNQENDETHHGARMRFLATHLFYF